MTLNLGNRWCVEVLSPVDGSILWTHRCFRSQDIADKWFKDTGNRYLSKAKINRACIGDLNNEFVKCYKVGKYATRELKKYHLNGERIESPTPSVYSSVADYDTDTSEETLPDETETETETETEN